MEKKDLRIVFMGTPEFAVESLRALIDGAYNIVGVITMPDKPAGRGHKIQQSAVKQYALEKNLTLLQPANLKDDGFLEDLANLKADLQIVVAFRMLPEVVWSMPRFGTFNIHASLLPQYRGAAPINWAIINGETETGVSSFFLVHEIDTGQIILQEKLPILADDNAGSLHDKLMELGGKLTTKTVDLILQEKVTTTAQEQLFDDESKLKSAPKLFKENCEIDINKSVEEVHNFVRGLSPYPVAWTNILIQELNKEMFVKVYESEMEFTQHNHKAGEIIMLEKKELKIALKDGFLKLINIQTPGKKRMPIGDFLNGLK